MWLKYFLILIDEKFKKLMVMKVRLNILRKQSPSEDIFGEPKPGSQGSPRPRPHVSAVKFGQIYNTEINIFSRLFIEIFSFVFFLLSDIFHGM